MGSRRTKRIEHKLTSDHFFFVCENFGIMQEQIDINMLQVYAKIKISNTDMNNTVFQAIALMHITTVYRFALYKFFIVSLNLLVSVNIMVEYQFCTW
jgi:hypothetical protein